MKEVVVTGACRTAVGKYLGTLKDIEPQEYAAHVVKEAAKRSKIGLDEPQELIFGEVFGYTPNIARCAGLLAGVPIETPAHTIDRQCASSMEAIHSAMARILSDDDDVFICGGVESMSRLPYYLDPSVRANPLRIGDKPLYDAFNHGVTIAQPVSMFPNLNMGLTAENVADKYGITREAMDIFSVESQQKWKEAHDAGKFIDEIVPFTFDTKKGPVTFDTDEHPRPDTTFEKLSKLKPAFKFDGTGRVTAGNSAGMNDGASAMVVMSSDAARERGLQPMVKILTSVTAAVDPRIMGIGPVPATIKALKRTGLKLEDMGVIELNEAFASQSVACCNELGMPRGTEMYKRVNVNGGAIAHGHPVGSSGCRICVTLIYEMMRRGCKYGLATLCIGGGMGMATIFELCD